MTHIMDDMRMELDRHVNDLSQEVDDHDSTSFSTDRKGCTGLEEDGETGEVERELLCSLDGMQSRARRDCSCHADRARRDCSCHSCWCTWCHDCCPHWS